MFSTGIHATRLIKLLEEAIKKYGDLPVYAGGTDYPEGVTGVVYNKTGNSYEPVNTFSIG